MFITSKAVFALFALASPAAASVLEKRLAPIPDVTYPHSNNVAVWVIGFQHNVTWDGSSGGNDTGSIALAKGGVADTAHTLASGFSVSAGRIEVTVPNVTPGSDYTVLLTVNGSSSSSAPFIIAQSKSSLPSSSSTTSGSGSSSGSASAVATTVIFPSTTIVATVAPGVSSAVSGASSGASSAASGASSGASSAISGASSALSSATSPSGSGSGSSSSSSSSSNAALGLAGFDMLPVKLISGAVALAVSAGALLL